MSFHSRFLSHPLTSSLLHRCAISRALGSDSAATRSDEAVCAQAADEGGNARGEARGDARGDANAGASIGDIDQRERNPGPSASGEHRDRAPHSVSRFRDLVSVTSAGDSASEASTRSIEACAITAPGGAAEGAPGGAAKGAPGGAAEGAASFEAPQTAAEGIDGRCDSRGDEGAGWRRDGEAAKRANSLSVALRNAATVEVRGGQWNRCLPCLLSCTSPSFLLHSTFPPLPPSLPPPSSLTSCVFPPSQCPQCLTRLAWILPSSLPAIPYLPPPLSSPSAPSSLSLTFCVFPPSLRFLPCHFLPNYPTSSASNSPDAPDAPNSLLCISSILHSLVPIPPSPVSTLFLLSLYPSLTLTFHHLPPTPAATSPSPAYVAWAWPFLTFSASPPPTSPNLPPSPTFLSPSPPRQVTEPCICRLGVGLSRLPRLTSLTLAHNGLEALPDSLSSLTALRHLDLSHNRLSSAPLHLTSALPHLKSLVLSGNPCAPSTPQHDTHLQQSTVD
ncbi:unnamed protein product [Closterium sp. Naga37s-1]|nr:unnamed protein product [Closterium sp. Naga37s-1]